MSKVPYKRHHSSDEDDGYEVVSIEEFCDRSSGSQTQLLTPKKSDKPAKYADKERKASSGGPEKQTETSLMDPKTIKKKLIGSFAPKSSGSQTHLLTSNDNINYCLSYESDKEARFANNEGKASSGVPETQTEQFLKDPTNFTINKNFTEPHKSSGLQINLLTSNDNINYCLTYESEKVSRYVGNQGTASSRDPESQMETSKKISATFHLTRLPKTERKLKQSKDLDEFRFTFADDVRFFCSEILPAFVVLVLILSTMWTLWWYTCGSEMWLKKKPASTNKPAIYEKTLQEKTNEAFNQVCQRMTDNAKFDCYPSEGASEKNCKQRGCCWQPATSSGPPYCYYPPQYPTYSFVNMSENKHGMTVYYKAARPSGYPRDIAVARLDFKYLSDDVLQIKIYDAEKKRFEVPVPQIPMVPGPISDKKYKVQLDSISIGFKVTRIADNVTIINTKDVGALILSDRFLQMSAILPADHVFGFGEHRARFMRDINWKTYTMFNRDVSPYNDTNLYGTHPFYMAVENNGKSHGMLLLNSNAMDVVVQPTPAITYRTVGGILNFFLFTGPSPKEVVAQYTSLIGRPFMPPYWSLGFHLCKYGYKDLNTTEHVWRTNRDAGIPFDVQWNDIDYMQNQNDFTINPVKFAGLKQFMRKVHGEGMHYVMLFDPGVSAAEKPGTYPPFDRGLELDIFVKNKTNQPFVAKVWNPAATVFPDFTHPNCSKYWVEMMSTFYKKVPYDGAWLDMNEPSNFLSGPMGGECEPLELPYRPAWINPAASLNDKTVCMEAKHHLGIHYDWHNLFALKEIMTTHSALTEIRGKRPFIISRATYPGMGHYAGHWSGDIHSTWEDMRMTIPELLNFAIFGMPMMGSDICGFSQNTTVELCKRWMQLGAFYPFSRNHADLYSKPQDPVSMGPEVVKASLKALRLRYRLLPYYYTLFWRAHIGGDTVVRPLFFEAPAYTKLHDIDDQFMIGPYMMVTPILEEGATRQKAFFPGPQKWYSLVDSGYITSDKWHEVNEDETVSVKGGGILVLQEPPSRGPVTTTNTRSAPLQLLAVPDNNNTASGEIYWDDGDSLNTYEEKKYSHVEFSLKDNELRSDVKWWGFGVPSINNITVLSQPGPVDYVDINGERCAKPRCQFTYVIKTKSLQIFKLNLSMDRPFVVKWAFKMMVSKKGKAKTRLAFLDLFNNNTCKNKDCAGNN